MVQLSRFKLLFCANDFKVSYNVNCDIECFALNLFFWKYFSHRDLFKVFVDVLQAINQAKQPKGAS